MLKNHNDSLKHYDIKFGDAAPFSHRWGGESICDCCGCAQKTTTLCLLDTNDPVLATYRNVMPLIPVVYCRSCSSADYGLQLRYVDGSFRAIYMHPSRPRSGVAEDPLLLPERKVSLGSPIPLDNDRRPIFSGFGALSTENYFTDIRGVLNKCAVCGQRLHPVLLLAQPSRTGPTPDLKRIFEDFYHQTKDEVIFMYPDAEYLLVGICGQCAVVGQEVGPY